MTFTGCLSLVNFTLHMDSQIILICVGISQLSRLGSYYQFCDVNYSYKFCPGHYYSSSGSIVYQRVPTLYVGMAPTRNICNMQTR